MLSTCLNGRFSAGAFALCLSVSGASAWAQDLSLELVDNGYSSTVFATFAPGDTNHLYIVQQSGLIQVLDLTNPGAGPTTFLDVESGAPALSGGGEQGLLGLAFAPDYATSGNFYVYTTRTTGGGDTSIEQYQRQGAAGSLTANAASRDVILSYNQPESNHNGGWMGFGPDGYLYIASGDGGGAFDIHGSIGNGQDITNNLLGAMLRIDPDGNGGYNIPNDNPFVGITGDDEIWAYGLRNPWRNSFDRDTGDLYIADVGQGVREEINFQHADSAGGENYGWRLREGSIQTPNVGGPRPTDAVDPVHEYGHNAAGGFSITGGYVYRGPITQARGEYYFADYVTGNIWTLEVDRDTGELVPGSVVNVRSDLADGTNGVNSIAGVSSFAEDAVGNLYLITLGGSIYRITTDRVLGDMNMSYDATYPTTGTDGDDIALFAAAINMSETAFNNATPNADYDAGDTNQDGSVNDEDALLMLEFLRGSHVSDDTISRFFDAVIPGDLTEDGFVGIEDLDLILANWEQAGITAGDHTRGDANNDGLVNADDLALVQGNWGYLLPGFTAGAVPEPATLAMLGLMGLITTRRRRR